MPIIAAVHAPNPAPASVKPTTAPPAITSRRRKDERDEADQRTGRAAERDAALERMHDIAALQQRCFGQLIERDAVVGENVDMAPDDACAQ